MTEQSKEILRMIAVLKEKKVSVSSVEQSIFFANGTIGKAAKEKVPLKEEKMEKLRDYFTKKFGELPSTEIPVLTKETVGITMADFENIAEAVKKNDENKVTPITESKFVQATDPFDYAPIDAKTTVVTPKGELKQVASKEALNRVSVIMAAINKKYGAGTIMKFGDKTGEAYDVVSTGSKRLDDAIGIGGLPIGRMVEMYGWESSGKSTIALHVIANAQSRGLKCLYMDAEHSFDPTYADSIGVEISEIIHAVPSCGEEALEIIDKMIEAKEVQVVVVDSVAALVPKAELYGEMGDSKLGLHARLMSQACRKLVNTIEVNGVLLIWINQLRHKIGIAYGNPEVTTGGNALKFYASIRMEVKKSTAEKNMVIGENGEKEGNQVTVKITKNKCSEPYRVATFDIIYGKGIQE